jgi:NAD dependent epimerase/dehydratase family enzyme
VLGEFSSEVLDSARILPRRLLDAGFTFDDPTIESALAWAWVSR